MNEPSFSMILTATEYAYKNEDEIWIVPIGCLKPKLNKDVLFSNLYYFKNS